MAYDSPECANERIAAISHITTEWAKVQGTYNEYPSSSISDAAAATFSLWYAYLLEELESVRTSTPCYDGSFKDLDSAVSGLDDVIGQSFLESVMPEMDAALAGVCPTDQRLPWDLLGIAVEQPRANSCLLDSEVRSRSSPPDRSTCHQREQAITQTATCSAPAAVVMCSPATQHTG